MLCIHHEAYVTSLSSASYFYKHHCHNVTTPLRNFAVYIPSSATPSRPYRKRNPTYLITAGLALDVKKKDGGGNTRRTKLEYPTRTNSHKTAHQSSQEKQNSSIVLCCLSSSLLPSIHVYCMRSLSLRRPNIPSVFGEKDAPTPPSPQHPPKVDAQNRFAGRMMDYTRYWIGLTLYHGAVDIISVQGCGKHTFTHTHASRKIKGN